MDPRPRPHRPQPTPAAGGAAHPLPTARPRPAPVALPRPHPSAALAEATATVGGARRAPRHTSPRRTLPGRDRLTALAHTSRLDRVVPLVRAASPARRASFGAIGAGAALFVVAAVATPLAGADPHSPARHAPAVVAAPAFTLVPAPPTVAAPSTAAPPSVVAKKDTTATKAPIDHGAISALAGNGIPSVALNAYRVAATRLHNVDPGCGIDWSLVAGIGREESDHGRFGGAVLHADGTSTPRIIGPALTGSVWDFIPAPPNGLALDGDAKYAHALGPMQFIPSTWAGYGADATGDGVADIFNINDAALGTARYLCAAGGDLTTLAGRERAVLAYNHNDQYLAQVLALADAYKRGVPISGIPVGNTTGSLPPVKPGAVPVANPGAPTAADPQRPATPAAPKPGTAASGGTRTSTAPQPASGTRTPSPGKSPSKSPTKSPTKSPSKSPSKSPTSAPSTPAGGGSPGLPCIPVLGMTC